MALFQEFQAIRALLTEGQEPDDVVVYRYLRGYKFSVEKAAAALNKTLVCALIWCTFSCGNVILKSLLLRCRCSARLTTPRRFGTNYCDDLLV